ncbi:MAG: glycoside hydrolase family 25 protein [Roseburia sp.]|nr:glycoside hydrolase family 25 protein [Roseburia sp.]
MRPSYGDFILEQERKERRKRRIVILIVILVLVLIIGAVSAVLYFKKDFSFKDVFLKIDVMGTAEDTEQQVYYSQEELDSFVEKAVQNAKVEASVEALAGIKQYLSEGKSAVEAFRAVYTNDLVVAADGRYHFIPIRDDLKHNDYTTENLRVLENGEYQYVEDGQVTSYKGIDVSRFQGKIDWNAVAADGVSFAFIRVGNRGYGSGAVLEDDTFVPNIEGANVAGVKAGVYFFSQAVTEAEAIEEANFVLEQIAPYQIDCPIVCDMEMIAGDEGRADSLTPEQRTQMIKIFCDTIANAGYTPMIYMNLELATIRINLEELEGYAKWFAYYNPEMYFPYEYTVWQYSEKGTVAGVPEKVDMNICFEPIWE